MRAAMLAFLLLATGCASWLEPNNARFCSEVERLGWFDDPMMRYLSSDKFGLFSPDAYYPRNPWNKNHNPTPLPTTNCFCWSKARQDVLAVCPADPWTPRGEPIPRWHAQRLLSVERHIDSIRADHPSRQ